MEQSEGDGVLTLPKVRGSVELHKMDAIYTAFQALSTCILPTVDRVSFACPTIYDSAALNATRPAAARQLQAGANELSAQRSNRRRGARERVATCARCVGCAAAEQCIARACAGRPRVADTPRPIAVWRQIGFPPFSNCAASPV